MPLHYLNSEDTTYCARLFDLSPGQIETINGNFGRPFLLYGPDATIDYSPREALNLLAWLQKLRPDLERAAQLLEKEGHHEQPIGS